MKEVFKDINPVIAMSLTVSLSSTCIASIVGIFIGIPASIKNFKGKTGIMRITDTLMSLPPVLMGLIVYVMLSRSGPFGMLELLFTPAAMIIAQTLLILPIVFGLTVSHFSKIALEIRKTCLSLGAEGKNIILTIIREGRVQILTIITVAFGRAISEVGAVMMVGGNIKGYTRVMTTYIALETGKGNFREAAVIGFILLGISFLVNYMLHRFQGGDET
ncbi:ABC transporter permease [Fonticella tunisiensis]|nr:ABC transporter permease [Fonticella tunisiensis]